MEMFFNELEDARDHMRFADQAVGRGAYAPALEAIELAKKHLEAAIISLDVLGV